MGAPSGWDRRLPPPARRLQRASPVRSSQTAVGAIVVKRSVVYGQQGHHSQVGRAFDSHPEVRSSSPGLANKYSANVARAKWNAGV